MADLLFEIGSEELPYWYVDRGRVALEELVVARLADRRLGHGRVRSYSTPRRLGLRVDAVADATDRRTEVRRGPSAEVAFDEDGAPTKAARGFAGGLGVDPVDLVVEETERGRYVFARLEVGGEPAAEVLAELLAKVVADLPAARKMRWGEVDMPYVRPVSWLLARLGSDVLPLSAGGVVAGGATRGHRFLAPGPHEVKDADAYLEVLREAWVLAEPAERHDAIVRVAHEAAEAEGLEPVWSEGLTREILGLVETPTAIVGRFDPAYLDLPDEVLATVMIHHQRFVPLRRADGSLADAFVGISNTPVPDPDVVRAGYERVLGGRLYDARFFWDADRAKTLAQHAWGLSGIGFHKDLGSMADKVTRVRESAPILARAVGADDAVVRTLEAALPVFRADLATQMVNELPELEGIMARAYATAEGAPTEVAAALEDGVRPTGPGEPLPAGEPGAILAVTDRVDKLLGFFALDARPSGSTDPFGLRRDATAVARIAAIREWEAPLGTLLAAVARGFGDGFVKIDDGVIRSLETFIWDRVASLLGEEGVNVATVRAVTSDGPPVARAARRAHLLTALAGTEAFAELLALYKRAANLAQNAPVGAEVSPKLFRAPEEAPLYEALPAARAGVSDLLAGLGRQLPAWELGRGPGGSPSPDDGLLRVLALKDPLDRFLDDVLVMVDDPAVRVNRLALLRETRDVLRGLGALERLSG